QDQRNGASARERRTRLPDEVPCGQVVSRRGRQGQADHHVPRPGDGPPGHRQEAARPDGAGIEDHQYHRADASAGGPQHDHDPGAGRGRPGTPASSPGTQKLKERSMPKLRTHRASAKRFRMTHRTLSRPANEALLHALEYAYRDRRARKRDMRKLWIARINAASRSQGLPYNQFMHGLKLAGVNINRKMLADLAVRDAESFSELVAVAKGGPKS